MSWRSVIVAWLIAGALGAIAWLSAAPRDRAIPADGQSTARAPSVRPGIDPAAVDRVRCEDPDGAVTATRQRWLGDRWRIARLDTGGEEVWAWPAEEARVLAFVRAAATAELVPAGGAAAEAVTDRAVRLGEGERVTTLRLGSVRIGGRVDAVLERPGEPPRRTTVDAGTAALLEAGRLAAVRTAEPLFRVGPGPRLVVIERQTDDGPTRWVLERRGGLWSASVEGREARAVDAERAEAVVDMVTSISAAAPVDADPELEARRPGVTIVCQTPLGLADQRAGLMTQTLRLHAADGACTALLAETVDGVTVSAGEAALTVDMQGLARAINAVGVLAGAVDEASSGGD